MRLIPLIILLNMSLSSAEDQAEKALEAARKFYVEGKYEQALERHVWFHENALRIDESYHGVRLSFALADWTELGEKYPAAIERLREIRDKDTLSLLAGQNNWDAFCDVQAINEELGEVDSTVSLFKSLDRERPIFATEVYDVVVGDLLATNEFSLARKYLSEPMSEYELAKKGLERGLAMSHGNNDQYQQSFQRIFSRRVVQIIDILDSTGDAVTARSIQKLALQEISCPLIKDALEHQKTEQVVPPKSDRAGG